MGGDSGEIPGGVLAGFSAGSRVAGYRLEEQIGAGGMAVVFRAVDERLGRPVALKLLAPALAWDEAFRHRFIREYRATAAVDDPHIIPVHEAGEADGVLFIAMRYVPGRDVRSLLHQEGPLSPGRVTEIVSQVASALDAAHAAGLIHRDVKPANMLLDMRPGRPDHVYLSDFGLSKGALSAVGLTGTGQLLGTPDYMAPEQIQGGTVDGRADQYALACAAFEMLTGQPPFRRDEATAVIWAHLAAPPPPLSSARPGLPAAVDQVFARVLAKTPAERYARCLDFAEALRTALGLAPYHSGATDNGPRDWPAPDHSATQFDPSADRYPGTSKDTPAFDSTLTSAGGVQPSPGTWPASGPDAGPTPVLWPAAGAGAGPAPPPWYAPGPVTPALAAAGPASREPAWPAMAGTPVIPAQPRRRKRLWIAAGTVVTLLAAVAGVVISGAHSAKPPPVLRPTGLAAGALTTSSLAFHWSGPSTGPVPDQYLIVQNGTVVGKVAGTVTSYRAQGLAPDTAYAYQVIAVRGQKRSSPSAAVTLDTLSPPVSDARLTGHWTAYWHVVVSSPIDGLLTANKKWNDSWQFSPECATGPCPVMLNGYIDGWPFTASLTRSGATYSGTTVISDLEYCSYSHQGKRYPVHDRLQFQITVNNAHPVSMAWIASSWAGTMTMYSPYTQAGSTFCNAYTLKTTVRSSP